MQRWNGWGDESVTYALSAEALAFLGERLGPGSGMLDATSVTLTWPVAAAEHCAAWMRELLK